MNEFYCSLVWNAHLFHWVLQLFQSEVFHIIIRSLSIFCYPLSYLNALVISFDYESWLFAITRLLQFLQCSIRKRKWVYSVNVKPKFHFFVLIGEHFQDSIFILRIKLPVRNRDIPISHLISGTGHKVLVKHYSLLCIWIEFFIIVFHNKSLSQKVCYLIQLPWTIR